MKLSTALSILLGCLVACSVIYQIEASKKKYALALLAGAALGKKPKILPLPLPLPLPIPIKEIKHVPQYIPKPYYVYKTIHVPQPYPVYSHGGYGGGGGGGYSNGYGAGGGEHNSYQGGYDHGVEPY